MNPRALLPTALAVAGLVAVAVGVFQAPFHPGPDSPVEGVYTAWHGALGFEERQLVRAAGLGVVGAVASLRRRCAAVLPLGAGCFAFYELFSTLGRYHGGIRTGLPGLDGTAAPLVLGAETYLLALGALLLVTAGALGLRARVGVGQCDATDESTHAT